MSEINDKPCESDNIYHPLKVSSLPIINTCKENIPLD